MIQDICREVELDRIYLGKVKKIVEFGAFVEVMPSTEGLLHISQIAESRIRAVRGRPDARATRCWSRSSRSTATARSRLSRKMGAARSTGARRQGDG